MLCVYDGAVAENCPWKQARRASMNTNVDRLASLVRFDRRRCGMLALFVWFAVLPCAPTEAENPAPAVCNRANFRMVIDVGHTETSYGAVSAHGNPEYDFNRRLAQELASRLWTDGFGRTEIVIQTDSDLARRARDLSSRRPDLVLSLHHDSVQDKYLKTGELDGQIRTYTEGFRGYSIFVSRDNAFLDDSERFAKLLGGELLAHGLKPTFHHHEQENRPIYDPQVGVFFFDLLAVLRQTTAPAVLLESAVITNPEDEANADDPAYRKRITDAIVSAVVGFCDSLARPRAAVPPSPIPKPDKSGLRK
jgi:N-acetylmuramoyl-L-alanine amidase